MSQTAALYDFTIKWEPFLLRPGLPEGGMEKPPEYKTVSKTGHLYKAGQSVGIDFTAKCPVFPNTVRGHAMLEYAHSLDKTGDLQNKVAEHIFQAYFTDGVYPDNKLMIDVAKKVGIDEKSCSDYMNNQENLRRAEEKAMSWRNKVQTGVPFFIINGLPLFSGAQDSDTFVKAFENVARKFPQAQGNL